MDWARVLHFKGLLCAVPLAGTLSGQVGSAVFLPAWCGVTDPGPHSV